VRATDAAGGVHLVLSDGRRSSSTPSRSWRRVVVGYLLLSSAALAALGAAGALVSFRAADREAVDGARRTTDLLAVSVVEPLLPRGLLRGDPAAVQALDRVVTSRVLSEDLVRVKVWAADGRILYSDRPELVGQRIPLGEDETQSLRTGTTQAELSDLTRPENSYERQFGELLEVYRPVRTPEGTLVLFETYSRFSAVRSRSFELFRSFAPITLVTALVLGLAQLPLMRWMLRQREAVQTQRERLLERSLSTAEDERRRIAGHLHDGVVQDLTGAAYVVASSAEQARRADQPELAANIDEAAAAVRESLRGLRSTLVEIYPPSLRTSGLSTALTDLVSPLRSRGIQVHVGVPADLIVGPETERLVYRVAQEAVRNVTKHAKADNLWLRVAKDGGLVTLAVVDDGIGMTQPPRKEAEGHVGLALLADRAAEAGALLELRSTPGRGTTVRLEVPDQ